MLNVAVALVELITTILLTATSLSELNCNGEYRLLPPSVTLTTPPWPPEFGLMLVSAGGACGKVRLNTSAPPLFENAVIMKEYVVPAMAVKVTLD
jgi:hypothetical protein